MPSREPVLAATIGYDFSFTPLTRPALAAIGVRPGTSWVRVDADLLDVRFGPWRLVTPVANVVSAAPSSPLSLVKVLGARLSLADRGLTFGSDTAGGVCIRFAEPVRGLVPFGLLRHPGLTVTVTTPDLLLTRLDRVRVEPQPDRSALDEPSHHLLP